MRPSRFIESDVEEVAPDTLGAEHAGYGEIALERRLRDALARLDPNLPGGTREDGRAKLPRLEVSTLEIHNRAFPSNSCGRREVEYPHARTFSCKAHRVL